MSVVQQTPPLLELPSCCSHQAGCGFAGGHCRRCAVRHPSARPAGEFAPQGAGLLQVVQLCRLPAGRGTFVLHCMAVEHWTCVRKLPEAIPRCNSATRLALSPPYSSPAQVGVPLVDVMVAVGMQPSKGAVRRMIKVGWRTGLVVFGLVGEQVCCCCCPSSCCCCARVLPCQLGTCQCPLPQPPRPHLPNI